MSDYQEQTRINSSQEELEIILVQAIGSAALPKCVQLTLFNSRNDNQPGLFSDTDDRENITLGYN